MIKFVYPDGTHCYRPLYTVHAIYRDDSEALVARVETPDRKGDYTFEIKEFEVLETGVVYN